MWRTVDLSRIYHLHNFPSGAECNEWQTFLTSCTALDRTKKLMFKGDFAMSYFKVNGNIFNSGVTKNLFMVYNLLTKLSLISSRFDSSDNHRILF